MIINALHVITDNAIHFLRPPRATHKHYSILWRVRIHCVTVAARTSYSVHEN